LKSEYIFPWAVSQISESDLSGKALNIVRR
jgi:hypothetical protein